jgi:murein L,D-transpeptidase YcbB/YkuD
MVNLVLSPTWTVPPRVARLDLLPKIKSEPAFLRQRGFRVFSGWGPEAVELDPRSVDWTAIAPGDLGFKFTQDPGPLNALGGVRFSLTNDFNIYLHDTPDRNLFSRSKRTFSSGCIRVRDVVALALFALDGDPKWPETLLRNAMESGRGQVVRLARSLPVHIGYMTAWVDRSGKLQFREDVYGHDEILAERLGLSGG